MIGDRWGVTDAEVERRYACDDLVPQPAMAAWRGVTVAAPVERVWPWVTQIRLAPYSYDWIDNLGRTSPRELRDLPEPVVGERFTRTAGRPIGTVLAVDPGRQLTGEIVGAVMSYLVEPQGGAGRGQQTRLLLKIVMPRWRVLAPFVSVGDLVMARKQLQTFASLAQQNP